MNRFVNVLVAVCALLVGMVSCSKSGSGEAFLPVVTGANGEVLVVMNDDVKKDTAGQYLAAMLGDVYLGLNADEPFFDMRTVPARYFDKNMQTFRNLIIVQVSDSIQNDTARYYNDRWARPQAVVMLKAKSKAALLPLLERNHVKIMSFFVKSERERLIAYNKKIAQNGLMEYVEKKWGVSMVIPNMYVKCKPEHEDQMSWLRMEADNYQASLLVYDFPMDDAAGDGVFSKEYLLNKRDALLRDNVGGPDGSYMKTELRYGMDEILYKRGKLHGMDVVELRGLWRLEGYPMGGPFILRAHADTVNHRVVVTDGFVYYPAKDRKRNLIRQLEAIMYTLEVKK